jgi:hypothetical protein
VREHDDALGANGGEGVEAEGALAVDGDVDGLDAVGVADALRRVLVDDLVRGLRAVLAVRVGLRSLALAGLGVGRAHRTNGNGRHQGDDGKLAERAGTHGWDLPGGTLPRVNDVRRSA